MKIYLDIDETILDNRLSHSGQVSFDHKPANYLKEFLENAISKHDVYWLSTHCNGDATVPVLYLSRYFSKDLLELIVKIKPTSWDIRKIDAINLNDDFMWFDDVLMYSEEKLLIQNNKLDSFIKVNLEDDPDFFKNYLSI